MSSEQNEPYRWYHDNVDHVPQHPHHDHVVDRCADRCDDQLPLFSQVGRGLQGDGYKVELVTDTINDTRIRGVLVDPHTGAETEEWRTDNINGGRLSYSVNKNYTTDPMTFTITFTLERPDDDERAPEDKRGWTFTTPAIPWVWDDEITPGVATLFTKPKSASDAYWTERLVYPEGKGPEDYDMPRHEEPWTVNLTYGKGGIIDCPTTSEETTDIATAKQQAIQAAKEHLHADLFSGEGSSDYIEAQRAGLVPLDGDSSNGKSVWDWIKYAIAQAEGHLHKDLYGAGTGNDHTTEIQGLGLLPLDGDQNGVANVWDWINWAVDQAITPVVNPEQHSQTISTYTYGDNAYPLYLCLMAPSTLREGTGITPLAAIRADIIVEYFDVLPNVVLTIDIKNEYVVGGDPNNTVTANKIYCDPKGLRIGTGEIAVVCYKMGATYYPVNLRKIELTHRTKNKNLTYPGSDPEVLSNCGFGWYGFLVNNAVQREDPWDSSQYVPVYPQSSGAPSLILNDAYYGPWQIYTGLGNIAGNDYRWVKAAASSATFLYIFNRSTGSLGTRVLLDYNRAYQVDYVQRRA